MSKGELPLPLMEKLADLYGCEMYDLYSEDADVIIHFAKGGRLDI